MKKKFLLIIGVYLLTYLLFDVRIVAQDQSLQDWLKTIPNVQRQDRNSFISDEAHLFSPQELQSINFQIAQMRKKCKLELAVVTLPTVSPYSITQVSNALFRFWGLGDKDLNNGLLILIVPPKMRLEVGYGLEGIYPDAICYQLMQKNFFPNFRKKEYAQGLAEGLRQMEYIYEQEELKNPHKKEVSPHFIEQILYPLLIIYIVYLLYFLSKIVTCRLDSKLIQTHPIYAYEFYKEENRRKLRFLWFYCFPIALIFSIYNRKESLRLKYAAERCPHCASLHTYREEVNPLLYKSYIDSQKLYEKEIASIDFKVYTCDKCQMHQLLVTKMNPSYSICPSCGYRAMQIYTKIPIKKGGMSYYRYIKRCRHCTEEIYEDRQDDNHTSTGTLLSLFALSSLLSSRRGGWSNNMPGSWGGGSSGGAGAEDAW